MKWHRPVRRFAVGAVVPALLFATACNNIWEWTVDENSFDALLADGRQAIQAADYATAEEKFAAAVNLKPEHSEARYYLAKAAVLNGGVDVFSLVQSITADQSEAGATTVFSYELGLANSLYRVNGVVLDNLRPIYEGFTTLGDFLEVDVALDLAVAYTLRGILRLRDTNGDGVIDGQDVSIEDIGLIGDGTGDYSLEGLDEIPPDDVNDMIGDLNDLLDGGGDLLLDGLEGSGIDIEDLGDLIDQLGGSLAAFYVNTGVPGNPGEGDSDGDGTIDEECLNNIDDDGDGLVDEDARVFGCP